MGVEKRRTWRMLLVLAVILCATANGFLLGLHVDLGGVLGALALTGLMVILALGGEATVARAEGEVAASARKLKDSAAELDIYKEKVRQLDRIVAMVSDQNDELRRRLHASHTEGGEYVIRRSEGNVSYLSDFRRNLPPVAAEGQGESQSGG